MTWRYVSLIGVAASGCAHVMPPPDIDYDSKIPFFPRIYEEHEVDIRYHEGGMIETAAACYRSSGTFQAAVGLLTLELPPACAIVKVYPKDPTRRPQCDIYYVHERYVEHEKQHCMGYPHVVPKYKEKDRTR